MDINPITNELEQYDRSPLKLDNSGGLEVDRSPVTGVKNQPLPYLW